MNWREKFQSHIPSNKLPVLNLHQLKGAEYCQLFKNIYSATISSENIMCYHGIPRRHLLILYSTQNHSKHFLKRNRFCRQMNAVMSGMLEIHWRCSLPIFSHKHWQNPKMGTSNPLKILLLNNTTLIKLFTVWKNNTTMWQFVPHSSLQKNPFWQSLLLSPCYLITKLDAISWPYLVRFWIFRRRIKSVFTQHAVTLRGFKLDIAISLECKVPRMPKYHSHE